MSDVLIRDVPADDLERLRDAAAEHGESMQSYLLDALRAQATYERRQDVLAELTEQHRGKSPVPESERSAVLDAIAEAHERRSAELGGSGRDR